MCGIAGIWDRRTRRAPETLAATAAAMAETLRHRGRDAGAVWCDAAAGLAFGHRRLSIIDLSPAGAQPMVSSCGRVVLASNGEVYNVTGLGPELEAAGRRFRGHSDTEVIVEGAGVWGRRGCGAAGEGGAGPFYGLLLSKWADPSQVVKDAAEPRGWFDDPRIKELVPDPIERRGFAAWPTAPQQIWRTCTTCSAGRTEGCRGHKLAESLHSGIRSPMDTLSRASLKVS